MGFWEGCCCFGDLVERNWYLSGLRFFFLSVLLMAYPRGSLIALYFFYAYLGLIIVLRLDGFICGSNDIVYQIRGVSPPSQIG